MRYPKGYRMPRGLRRTKWMYGTPSLAALTGKNKRQFNKDFPYMTLTEIRDWINRKKSP